MIPSGPRWQFQICMQEFGFKLHNFDTQQIERGNELRKTKNKIPTYIFSATKRKMINIWKNSINIPEVSCNTNEVQNISKLTIWSLTHFAPLLIFSKFLWPLFSSLCSLSKQNHSDSPLTHFLTVWWWWVPIWGGFAVVVGWVMAWTSEDRSTEGRQQWRGKRESHIENRATKREQKSEERTNGV